jgi:poly(3-hydroxybutyrate) depolymerase
LPENSSPRNRRANGDAADEMRGFDFFDEIIETYTNEYCIDMDSIYVAGHSLG